MYGIQSVCISRGTVSHRGKFDDIDTQATGWTSIHVVNITYDALQHRRTRDTPQILRKHGTAELRTRSRHTREIEIWRKLVCISTDRLPWLDLFHSKKASISVQNSRESELVLQSDKINEHCNGTSMYFPSLGPSQQKKWSRVSLNPLLRKVF